MNVRLSEEQKNTRIMKGRDVFKIMREVILREGKYRREMEHGWVMSLGPDNLILNLELVSLGSNRRSLLEPMQVFRFALIKNADKIIMIHNHVDQELIPSEDDLDTTDRMIKVGEIIDLEVVDHVIISTKAYFSFHDSGLMEKLRASSKYALAEHEIIKIRKEAEQIGMEKGIKIGREEGLKEGKKEGREEGLKEGEERGLKKGKIEMAQKMKTAGETIEKISDYTGLPKKEIEKL
jgi:DNA repair protein RadC